MTETNALAVHGIDLNTLFREAVDRSGKTRNAIAVELGGESIGDHATLQRRAGAVARAGLSRGRTVRLAGDGGTQEAAGFEAVVQFLPSRHCCGCRGAHAERRL